MSTKSKALQRPLGDNDPFTLLFDIGKKHETVLESFPANFTSSSRATFSPSSYFIPAKAKSSARVRYSLSLRTNIYFLGGDELSLSLGQRLVETGKTHLIMLISTSQRR